MSATLQNWLSRGWLAEHQTSPKEIVALLAVADRDLSVAQEEALPLDWRLNIAYNAALQAANAALAASGHRAEMGAHHFRALQSLAHTIGLDAESVDRLDKFRKKRNTSSYRMVGTVSEEEAGSMLEMAQVVVRDVRNWLGANRPELLEAT